MDPKVAGRQVGRVTIAPSMPVLSVRCRKNNGQWAIGVLISTLLPQEVITLTRQPIDRLKDTKTVLLAYVYFYDQRGGGVEIESNGSVRNFVEISRWL